MLINADVKGLEVVIAAELSQDRVLKQELLDGLDIHEINRDTFGLGEGKAGRLIAKIFKFRLIYGGSAYSYANDADFMGVSTDKDFWQDVIDKYYTKYKGIAQWHKNLILEAQSTGKIIIPSGRYFPITPDIRNYNAWPLTIIKNYPVQGFGADCVMLARIRVATLIRHYKVDAKLIGTIHDSLVVDTEAKNLYTIGKLLKRAIEEVPMHCMTQWGYNFTLPLHCEISYGSNKTDMQTLTI